MQQILHIIGIVFGVLAAASLALSILLFVRYQIPKLWKERSGNLSQKEIDAIREKNNDRGDQINVFEDLEKKAKSRSNNTHLNLQVGTGPLSGRSSRLSPSSRRLEEGTSLLQTKKSAFPGFEITKNIRFVSTSELL